MNSGADHGRDPAIEAAAAEWLVRHDRGLSPAQQDAFLQWRAESPAHREAFQRHHALWREFDALSHWRPEHSAVPNPDLLARPRRSRVWRWIVPASLAAAAAVALVFGPAPVARPGGGGESLSLEAEAYRRESLPDGSTAELNRGAHLVLQFTAAERRIVLVQGEARFSVAKNPCHWPRATDSH